ncbi:MAG: hypothetical protein R3279_11970 [Putridiphycobacter sp.]|nr:hypothetical protein [Putridiphycobacter sp.]
MIRLSIMVFTGLLFASFRSSGTVESIHSQTESNLHFGTEPSDSAVLVIFNKKCNVCHAEKKQVVFDAHNLQQYVLLIETQVLIKQRMPKKKSPPLTAAELMTVKAWVAANK